MCDQRSQKLTPTRRQVLEVLLSSHKPLGAYEIIDRAAKGGTRHAPITVYRALEFLIENGLAHRIESRNAFIACVHRHASDDLVVFLICERCGEVGEAPSQAVAEFAEERNPRRGLCAEGAGDRDHRHLRELPIIPCLVSRGVHERAGHGWAVKRMPLARIAHSLRYARTRPRMRPLRHQASRLANRNLSPPGTPQMTATTQAPHTAATRPLDLGAAALSCLSVPVLGLQPGRGEARAARNPAAHPGLDPLGIRAH